ncbi:MAG: hypothetical protein IJ542_00835 [Clostridia bacterium]|nr:hypothetical protein [Clostridia bacterium]
MAEKQYVKLGKLQYIYDNPDDLVASSFGDVELNKKTVLILGGNITNSIGHAGRYAKYVERWLNNKNNVHDIDIYAAYYDCESPLQNNYLPNPAYNYAEMAQTLIDQWFKSGGKLLTKQEIIKKLDNLTIFCHSAGVMVLNNTLYNIKSLLAQNNFSNADIKSIFSHIYSISYAPFDIVDQKTKAVYICPAYDSLGSSIKLMRYLYGKGELKTTDNFSFTRFRKFLGDSPIKAHEYCIKQLKKDAICVSDFSNNIIVIPDLLFDAEDHIYEDHGLAGVMPYNEINPNQTSTGKITSTVIAKLLQNGVYSPSARRNINALFDEITELYKQNYTTIGRQ